MNEGASTFTEMLEGFAPTACCFTGHRAIPDSELKTLKKRLKAKITELAEMGCLSFYAGGAQGFDTLAAEVVLSLKKSYPLRLLLLLPCRDQTRQWEEADVRRYHKIMAKADEVTFLSEHYTRFCMHVRNRALVDASSVCIAYMTDASKGGTAYTVKYAEKKGVPVYNLAE